MIGLTLMRGKGMQVFHKVNHHADDNQNDDDIGISGMMIIVRIRRTNDYMAPWMTQLITPRLPEELLQKIEGSAPHTPVRDYHDPEKCENLRNIT